MTDEIVTHAPAASFLSVGLPLKLTIQTVKGKVQCGSTLLGWKENAWLICEWPAQVRHEVACPAGTTCLVSYVYAGKLIGYRSEVRETLATPAPLLFLSFPKTVEEVHLRKHLRVPSNEPISLMQMTGSSTSCRPTDQALLGGLVQDLSLSGCSVLLSQLAPGIRPGAVMKLEFELPGLGHVTNLSGVVKNLQEQEQHYLIGLEFRFNNMEYIEFRGWGGTVQNAIEHCVFQKQSSLSVVPETT